MTAWSSVESRSAVSAKIVFRPRFLPVELATPGFTPGTLDTRELGVRVYRITVAGEDVTGKGGHGTNGGCRPPPA